MIECRYGPTLGGEIAQATGLSPSLVSQDLRLLRATHIGRAERQDRHVLYSLDDQHIDRVLTDILDHLGEPAQITEGTPQCQGARTTMPPHRLMTRAVDVRWSSSS